MYRGRDRIRKNKVETKRDKFRSVESHLVGWQKAVVRPLLASRRL